jgi:hypothetical protein
MASELLPVGPMYYDDSRDARPTRGEKYESQMLYWRDQFRKEALDTARLNEEIKKIPDYVKCLSGDYWDRRRPRYKSTFFANRLDKARVDNLALLTDSRPMIDVKAERDDLEDQAKIIHKLFEYEWLDKKMDMDLVRVADITKLMGTGFWKIGASYPGSLKITSCGPDSVLPVQPGFSIQESTGIFYKTWKSISYIKQAFPFDSMNIERESSTYDVRGQNTKYNRPDNMDEYIWNGLSPAFQRALGQNNPPPEAQSSIFKSIELQEYYVDDPTLNESTRPVLMKHPYWPLDAYNWWYWVQPGERLYPRKRLVTFAGRRRLYDGPAPYWHGLYPFACLRLNPVPWSFWGLSQYRNLLPLNKAINDIVAGLLDMVKRALNPQAITKQGSVSPASWNDFFSDMPGSKLYMGAMANVNTDIRYMQPPEIPAYVFNLLLQYLVPEFDRMANSMDVQALGKKKQVPSGDTLDQMRDSLNTSLRLEERYMEVFLRDAGQQALSHFFQFYTTKQRMKLLGSDGTTLADYDTDPGSLVPDSALPKWNHWRHFDFKVISGSIHGGSKDRDKLYAMQLYRSGAISLQYLLETLEIPNPEKIMMQIAKETQMGLRPTGKQPRSQSEKKGKAA